MVKHLRLFLTTLLLAVCAGVFAEDVTVTFTAGTEVGTNGAAGTGDKLEKDNVSLVGSDMATTTASYRIYAGSTFTVTAPDNISKIVITGDATYSSNTANAPKVTANVGTVSVAGMNITWTGSNSTVVFSLPSQVRASSIAVTYASGITYAYAAPVFAPESGTYWAPVAATISTEETGVDIWYAIDGGEEQKYTEPFTVSATSSYYAYVKATEGEGISPKAQVSYTIGTTYTNIAAANTAATVDRALAQLVIPEAGYIVTYVDSRNLYLTDGSKAILIYGNNDGTLKAGDKVTGTVVGDLYLYKGIPEIAVSGADKVALTVLSSGNVVRPVVVDAATLAANFADYANMYVAITGATFSAPAVGLDGTKRLSADFTVGETALQLYNNFSFNYTKDAGTYTVWGIAGSNTTTGETSTIQLYPIAAEFTYTPAFASGVYYLKNVATGRYLGAGNSWGTQATLTLHADYVRLVALANGAYTIDSRVKNGLGDNGFMDNALRVRLSIVNAGEGVYNLTPDGLKFYGAPESGTVMALNLTDGTAPVAQWQLITAEEMLATLGTATQESPLDATFLIDNPDFSRQHEGVSAWTIVASNKNMSGGNNSNNNAESYHSTFDLSQLLANAPAGVYSLTAQGFYRKDVGATEDLPYFFANDSKGNFLEKTGSENSMSTASVSFSAGNYKINPIYVTVPEGGTLTVGARLESNTALWCIWDNFELTYYGADADANALQNAALIEELDAQRATAEAYVASSMLNAATVDAVNAALAATETVEPTPEALAAAIDQMKIANGVAKNVADQYKAIAGMETLMASTNVVTAEAAATYQALIDDYKTKWEANELTEAVVNPYTIAGWHSANNYDDLLLSAWSIGGSKSKDFDNALYINTWSVEGTTDGTGFGVPFYEYWTGDANSLGATQITATVEGLEPGQYTVTAWSRVRIKNAQGTALPTGITFTATGAEAPADACAGTQVGTSQFYIHETAVVATVGEDGILTITYDVAAENNVSWLSFQNVKYEKVVEPEPTELVVPLTFTRVAGLGYAADSHTVDFAPAFEFLGVENASGVTTWIKNVTDGALNTNSTDGWRNINGDIQAWGDNASVCVKLFLAETRFEICDMPNANQANAGDTRRAMWALTANEKTVVYDITINYTTQPEVAAEVVKTIEAPAIYQAGASYATPLTSTASFSVDEVCEALGITDISEAELFIMNVTDDAFVKNTTDGWRDGNGDAAGWGAANGVCVKISDPASGNIDYISCHPNTTMEAGTVYHAKWAFIKDANAVVIDVVINFLSAEEYAAAVGIDAINGADKLQGQAYDLQGRRVQTLTKGGIYIVNGKKVIVR
jgi:hypothetical protein